MAVLSGIEPREVFQFFEEISAIPRGTFDTERISDYCVKFAKDRGLSVIQDKEKNVIIRKEGSKGYENSEPVILQGHLDMVCEKSPSSSHDFAKDGLDLYIEDGFVKARDTTLGGDDGIAVAMTLALLDSDEIPHPPLEAVFTTDEEVGMGGAMGIDLSALKGRMLINIDSEEEGILTVGCAGGYRFCALLPTLREEREGTLAELKIYGLKGGHSGVEIHKQRGNAHKLMGRFLNGLQNRLEFFLLEVGGGSKDNVIATESAARLLISEKEEGNLKNFAKEMKEILDGEFMGDEPELQIDLSFTQNVREQAMTKSSAENIVRFLCAVPNGVQGMNRRLSGLVETSLNLGILKTTQEGVESTHLVRSSMESKKQETKELLSALAAMAGGESKIGNEYPAWMYREDSRLRDLMISTYQELFGEKPEVTTIHAGLECGLFLGKRGDLDCVSFGPNILDAHSFKERLDIASTERSFTYLKEILKKCR